MNGKRFSYIIRPSRLMCCFLCNHYIGEHHDKGCSIQGCECWVGCNELSQDMRDGELRGYVSTGYGSSGNKIAILIGSSYHILNISAAEDLAHFILSIVDVAKMVTIPEDK